MKHNFVLEWGEFIFIDCTYGVRPWARHFNLLLLSDLILTATQLCGEHYLVSV